MVDTDATQTNAGEVKMQNIIREQWVTHTLSAKQLQSIIDFQTAFIDNRFAPAGKYEQLKGIFASLLQDAVILGVGWATNPAAMAGAIVVDAAAKFQIYMIDMISAEGEANEHAMLLAGKKAMLKMRDLLNGNKDYVQLEVTIRQRVYWSPENGASFGLIIGNPGSGASGAYQIRRIQTKSGGWIEAKR